MKIQFKGVEDCCTDSNQCANCQNLSRKSRMNRVILLFARGHTGIPQRAPMQESSGGAFSSFLYSVQKAFSRFGG